MDCCKKCTSCSNSTEGIKVGELFFGLGYGRTIAAVDLAEALNKHLHDKSYETWKAVEEALRYYNQTKDVKIKGLGL